MPIDTENALQPLSAEQAKKVKGIYHPAAGTGGNETNATPYNASCIHPAARVPLTTEQVRKVKGIHHPAAGERGYETHATQYNAASVHPAACGGEKPSPKSERMFEVADDDETRRPMSPRSLPNKTRVRPLDDSARLRMRSRTEAAASDYSNSSEEEPDTDDMEERESVFVSASKEELARANAVCNQLKSAVATEGARSSTDIRSPATVEAEQQRCRKRSSLVVRSVSFAEMPNVKIDKWGEMSDINPVTVDRELTGAQRRKSIKLEKDRARVLRRDQHREIKWLYMLKDDLLRSSATFKTTKRRIRKGIPDSLRARVWPLLVGADANKVKTGENSFAELVKAEIPEADEEQIRKDLPRSFQTHVMFKSPEPSSRDVVSTGQGAMYRVLSAYCAKNRDVGYCQGMAGLAGLVVMYLAEEDAFWMVDTLMAGWQTGSLSRRGLFSMYEPGMPLVLEYVWLHEMMLNKYAPRVAHWLTDAGITGMDYAFNWILTLFSRFPRALYVRVFDILLNEGMKIVLRVSVSVIKRIQRELLGMEYEDILSRLVSLHEDPSLRQADKIIAEAVKIKVTTRQLQKWSAQYQARNGSK